MPEKDSSDSSSSLFSLNSIMTLVTLIGGVFLVSHKLSSDRPSKGAVEGTRPLGNQNIEARLWEDPFASWDKLSTDDQRERTRSNLVALANTLTPDLGSNDDSHLLVLGVMVSGQPYAEDTESRVRTRYAVGAALGSGGYKPETADHIGLAACKWPGAKQLREWKANPNAKLVLSDEQTNCANACIASDERLRLRIPFEVYERREYFPVGEFSDSSTIQKHLKVLLLWLDEEYFDDDPASRLALFCATLTNLLTPINVGNHTVDLAIIGPRYSSTLRTLVASNSLRTNNPDLWCQITDATKTVKLILATPTAMDEALVENTNCIAFKDFEKPRRAVSHALRSSGLFKEVINFACTDKQLAHEALAELALRDIDLIRNTNNHLVLISEWDSFFARMSGLAFAAEMSCQQTTTASVCSNAFDFMEQMRMRKSLWPPNLHRFVYLQGLDGEAANSQGKEEKEDGQRRSPTTIEEIRNWKPIGNKAEGQAQFDYLDRLGDRIAGLDRALWNQPNPGRLVAVGINGSDVYDTLLILQSLRQRLPDTIFFTSDLDARLWDPRELPWTRNLLVFSGYGLQLTNNLQAGAAPFRESAQCAQYLATLCALQCDKVLNAPSIIPRRFEIGRNGPVDLSLTNVWPHPLVRLAPRHHWLALAIALVLPTLAIFSFYRPCRRLAWPSWEYRCEPLSLTDADLGGEEGVQTTITFLKSAHLKGDSLAEWLLKGLEGHSGQAATRLLLKKFNALIFMEDVDALRDVFAQTKLFGKEPSRLLLQTNLLWALDGNRLRARDRQLNRAALNELLTSLSQSTTELAVAAGSAREASIRLYENRKCRPWLFWGTVVLLGTGIVTGIVWAWNDTYISLNGEPFNFRGTSAWPAEFIRFAVLALSLIIVIRTQRKLNCSVLEITRRYRLTLDGPISGQNRWKFWVAEPPLIDAEISADTLWREYQRARNWRGRLLRVACCLVIYIAAFWALMSMTAKPLTPLRGPTLAQLDGNLLIGTVIAFLVVTFWMIDASLLSAWFIRRLSRAPTRYSEATRKHFSSERALDDAVLVDEWVDLQLIADLTEPVGRLVFWPFIAVLLMLVARNPWWDHWTWHWPLIAVFAVNMCLAASGSLILQKAALKARQIGIQHLKTKLNQKLRKSAPSIAEHESNQAELLLDEINNLRRGAFAPISKNPLVGAVLVNSSGVVVIQVLALLLSK